MVTPTENKNKAMEKMRKKWMPLHFEETAPKGGLISDSVLLWHKSPKKGANHYLEQGPLYKWTKHSQNVKL